MRIFQLLGLFASCTLILGCASNGNKPQPIVNKPIEVESSETSTPVASAITPLIVEYQDTGNFNSLLDSLIVLANSHQNQGDCVSADLVVKHTLKMIPASTGTAFGDNPSIHSGQANIIRSECAIKRTESTASSPQILNWIDSAESTQNLNDKWQSRLKVLIAYKQGLNQEYENALNTMMPEVDADGPLAQAYDQFIFYWLANVSPESRMTVITAYPRLFKYQRLLNVLENTQINDLERQEQLKRLIANSSTNNQFRELPPQVSRYLSLSISEQQSIAVLLPLSGRLAGQGDAIKQGILAAYYEQISKSTSSVGLNFIDTGSESELLDTVNIESLAPYSIIVGPLLKSHIEAVRGIAPSQSLKLYLNQVENDSLNLSEESLGPELSEHYFALSPEQEAQQLAEQMLKQNIAHPVLIYDNSNVTERMAQAFLETWKQARDSDDFIAPSEVKYADNKSMRIGITSALDVLQSQQRINQLSNLVNEEVYSVTRNRRDVDAFVVFARPDQVELINPIIESSMSLFTGQQIPVFATSYSYNHKQNKNTLRDLRNLVFMDMPFVLPQGRNTELASEVDTLFNQPSSTYLRLFAFGYDALATTQQIIKLSVFDQLSTQGLTGELSVGEQNEMRRQLSILNINAAN